MSSELYFRDIQPADFDHLHAIASDWKVVRQLGSWPWPPDPEFTQSRSKPYVGNGFVHGVFLDTNLIGSVAVTKGVIGYCLHSDFWGRGYGSQIMSHALMLGFSFEWDRIVAEVWEDNVASQSLLNKFGFRYIDRTVEYSKARKVDTISLTFELSKDDWTAQQSLSR